MKRKITIEFVGEEIEYQLAIGLIARQLFHGQVRGHGSIGLAAYSYTVETDHSEQTERESEC